MSTVLTEHAEMRCIQWNITHSDINFIVKHTKPNHRAGATFYQFRYKSLPKRYLCEDRYRRLVGTTVVACKHCKIYVLTVYRNPKAFKVDSRKQKYNTKKDPHYCPHCEKHVQL